MVRASRRRRETTHAHPPAVSSQLVETLDRLLSMPAPAPPVIHSTLDTMTALLLLHPPSRVLFARRPALLSLLDLLEPSFLSAFGSYGDGILSNALATLMVAMLDTPRVARTFEKEGLETVLRLAREGGSRGPKAEELLQVWMLPESADADDEPWRSRSPSKSLANSLRQSSMTSTTDHPVGTMRRIHEPLPDFNQLNPNTVRHASQVGEGGSVLSGALSGSLRSPEEKARMLMRAAGGDEPAISDMVADWRATSRTGGVRGLA